MGVYPTVTTPDTIHLLDHGYLKLITSWGSEEQIIEAARMSTAKGFVAWGKPVHEPNCETPDYDNSGDGACPTCGMYGTTGDEKLLAYLWKHKHFTPFEMAGLTIEVQAPIFVFREWHRHRTQSYNEMSARYIALPDLQYVPSLERIVQSAQATTNKQAKGEAPLSQADIILLQGEIMEAYGHGRKAYEGMLRRGLSRELARIVVPVGQYSRMRASANLRNWFAFLTLRADVNAQWEIRQYATALSNIIALIFPRVYDLWVDDFTELKL